MDFELCFNIGPGNYSITVAAHTHDTHLENNYDWWDQACVFQVVPGNEYQFQGTSFLDVAVRHEGQPVMKKVDE